MKKPTLHVFFRHICLVTCLLTAPLSHASSHADSCHYLRMQLKDGAVIIKMRPDLAPHTVQRICTLAKENFYDGIVFHRVIAGFMAQTGDPTGTGMGGSGQPLKAEFSQAPHVRGTVSMARAQDPDSADSQFFIVLKDARFLDGQYTVFGQVIRGMDAVDKIKKGDGSQNGQVEHPDRIISLKAYQNMPPS